MVLLWPKINFEMEGNMAEASAVQSKPMTTAVNSSASKGDLQGQLSNLEAQYSLAQSERDSTVRAPATNTSNDTTPNSTTGTTSSRKSQDSSNKDNEGREQQLNNVLNNLQNQMQQIQQQILEKDSNKQGKDAEQV
jgi:hypothetical protein